MKTNLNIGGFIQYAKATGKYNADQLDAIESALITLEQELAHYSILEYGTYSVNYITNNLPKCCKKITGFMMTAGMKEPKAKAAAADFKKWIKLFD